MALERGKILLFSSLSGRDLAESFHRDNGLLVEAFRDLGHAAYLVCPEPAPDESDDRLLVTGWENLLSAVWWRAQAPWGVILNTWGAPRFRRLHESILAACPRVVERLDTDGSRSPCLSFEDYLQREISAWRDFQNPVKRRLAVPLATARTAAAWVFPAWIDVPTVETLEKLPHVSAESPLAAERMRRLMRRYGRSGANISCVPHPVDDSGLPNPAPLTERENQVISIARWDADQKNLPLLLQTLEMFLHTHVAWRAFLPGQRPANWRILRNRFAPKTSARIDFPGVLERQQISEALARSKVFLTSSRHESFGIAAAEALCSGCSVVGPHQIPSMPWFCGAKSGTIATRYTALHLADSLAVEADAWRRGERDTSEIARHWRKILGSRKVAERLASILAALPRTP